MNLMDYVGPFLLLLLQGLQEVAEPRLPVGTIGPDGGLGLAQRQEIGFLGLLDDAFQ